MMRFLANENFPVMSVRYLRSAGYDVAYGSENAPGAEDSEVLTRAVREERIILTFDRDYGELIYRLRMPSPVGVVYFRYFPATPYGVHTSASKLLEEGVVGSKRWWKIQ